MRRAPCLLALCLAAAALAWAEGEAPFTMLSPGDPALEDLRFAVRAAGESFLSLTPPLSRDEVIAILDGLEARDSLPGPAREACARARRALTPPHLRQGALFSTAFQVKAALEGRLRSNTSVPWLKADTESPPVLALPVGLYFGGGLGLFFEPFLGADPWYYSHPVSGLGSNVPWEAERVDLNFPLRAFAAAGGRFWAVQAGRDKVSYGPGRTGNLALSDNPDYYDFARLSLFAPSFKYSFLVSQMPMNGAAFTSPAEAEVVRENDLQETTNRYLYLHRFDMRFRGVFSLGISEGMMAGNSPLELRFLNPMMIFHSFYAWRDYDTWGAHKGDMIGSLLSLDMEWAFLPGWAAYGQIVMNEFSTPYEAERFPDQPPRAMGFLLGLERVFSPAVPAAPAATASRPGWEVSLWGELVYTDPFLYILSSPYASMVWMRRSSDLGNKDLRYAWLGHREGRDFFLAALGARARGGPVTLGLEASFIVRGERGLIWDWSKAYNTETSPSGSPESQAKVLCSGEWRLLPSLTLSAWAGASAIFDASNVKSDNEYGVETGIKVMYQY